MAAGDSADLGQLQAENEQLRQQLASERAARSARWRSVATGVLTVVAVLATTVALLVVWTLRTLTDTDLFVQRVGGIIEQPEVAEAIGAAAAEELVGALDVEGRLAEQLPEQLAVAAGPIAGAAEGYLAEGVTALVETEAVQQAWELALATGHRITIGILSGTDTTAIENTGGVIVLDLTPLINEVVDQGAEFLSDLLGRDIDAPEISEETVDSAVAALEEQLGEDLPVDFGQVVLFESDDLAAAQQAYQAARVVGWISVIGAVLFVVLAVLVATNRLRTGLWIVAGVAGLLLVVVVALQPLKTSILDAAAAEGLDGAIGAAFESAFASLRDGVVVVLALGAVAVLVLLLTRRWQPTSPAEALRQSSGFASAHRAALLAGGALVAVGLALLIPGSSWAQLLVVLLLYGLYSAAVLLAASLDSETATTDTDAATATHIE